VKISFIGLGKLGLPCAEAVAQKGHTVSGYDIVNVTSDTINVKDSIAEAVAGQDIVFVAVPTPHDPAYDGRAPTAHLEPKDFSYDIVKECLEEANKFMTKNQLLVLISTVLPGTTRREFVPLVNNTRFVYNPYLIAMGTVAWDMINPEMIMIGTEDGSATTDARELVKFYQSIMENNPRYEIGTWDECECIKVFYNTFISTKIGLVNMMQDVAQKQGNINVDVVTRALSKSTMRIISKAYMKAGMGDGGACHPRDNIALRYMAQELGLGYDLFDSVMNAREKQAENMAIEILKYGNKVQFSSDSYKPGVEYVDGSYSLLVQHYVKEHGGYVVKETPHIYVLVHEGDTVPDNVPVFDPWRTYRGPNVVYYGNTRKNKGIVCE
jgi:UDPglucose 6-dehydrogenase